VLEKHPHLKPTQDKKLRCSYTGVVMENNADSVMEYLNSKEFKSVRGPRKDSKAWDRLLAPSDKMKWRKQQVEDGMEEIRKRQNYVAAGKGRVREDGFFNGGSGLGECDEYKDPTRDPFGLDSRAKGKRMTCDFPKRGTQTPVFGTYEYKPDPYYDAGHAHRLQRRENKKKIEETARRPFSYCGPNIKGHKENPFLSEVDKDTFEKKEELEKYVATRKAEQARPKLGPNPTVLIEKRNILTKPPVKGTYGYARTTLEEVGQQARIRDAMLTGKEVVDVDMTITYKNTGYDIEKEERRLRRIKIKKGEAEVSLAAQRAPYKIMNTGTEYFDDSKKAYGDTEEVLLERRSRPASAPVSRETRRRESILERYERIKAMRVEELKRQQKAGLISCVGPVARETTEEGEKDVQKPAFRPSHPPKKGKVGAGTGISMGIDPPYMSDPIPQPKYRKPDEKSNYWIPNHTIKSHASKTVLLDKMNIAEVSVECGFYGRANHDGNGGVSVSAR
jgi:hypothetical protein